MDKQKESGDLNKINVGAEEREIQADVSQLNIQEETAENSKAEAEKVLREKELQSVVIAKEDVELLMKEFEIAKPVADRRLRENHGRVVDALRSLANE